MFSFFGNPQGGFPKFGALVRQKGIETRKNISPCSCETYFLVDLISLSDGHISHEEFSLVIAEVEKSHEMKEEVWTKRLASLPVLDKRTKTNSSSAGEKKSDRVSTTNCKLSPLAQNKRILLYGGGMHFFFLIPKLKSGLAGSKAVLQGRTSLEPGPAAVVSHPFLAAGWWGPAQGLEVGPQR